MYTQIKVSLVTLLLGWSALVFSEGQNDDYLALTGRVTDAESGDVIPFAAVSLQGTSLSIVSNNDGVFSLKVPLSASAETLVEIKAVGYRSGYVAVSEFVSQKGGRALTVRLLPAAIELDPAVILGYDAYDLFRSAFERTWTTCTRKHIGMTAFYREFIRKGNRYLSLNEAVIDIDKAAPRSATGDKVAIYKGRGNVNYSPKDSLMMRFQGGIVSALAIDQVSHPFTGLTLEELPEYYDFQIGGTATIGERSFFIVEFRQHDWIDDPYFRGKVFIETETLGIGRVEFSMNVEGRPEASQLFIVRKAPDYDITVDGAHYVVNYKEQDGLWYFNDSYTTLSFATRFRKSLFWSHYNITTELAVTDHKPGDFVLEKSARIFKSDELSQKVADFKDNDFWGSYNVIEPDQSIETCIRRIIRQLKSR